MATITSDYLDENGNHVFEVEPDVNQTITLATANTYVDKNIIIKPIVNWNIAEFDKEYFNTNGLINIAAPDGYIFDKIYLLIYWYGTAHPVGTYFSAGFYEGPDLTLSKQVLRTNGSNKMGAAYITAEINNLDDYSAIAFGEAYLYNSNGTVAALNNPINSYGVGRYSSENDFKYFSISGFPHNVDGAYCCIRYSLKEAS